MRRSVLVLVLLLVGCGADEAPPPALPDVVLVRDGRPVEPPAGLAPTVSDGERHAWSLGALFGPHERGRGARVVAEQADGTRVDIDRPFAPAGARLWVLRGDRKGRAHLALVDPRDPFPGYHGRGGGRGRPGAVGVGVRDVLALHLHHGEGRRGADGEGARRMLQLEIVVDGRTRTLDEEALATLEPIEVRGDSGKGVRDAWDLRALVRALAGAGARLTEVRGREGATLPIPPADWADEGRVPVLRLNRRGRFKFHWASADLEPAGEVSLRDVEALVITTR